jgi:hypothetical protein
MGQVPGLTWPPIRITTLYNAPTESSASGQQKGEGISGSESTLVSATDGRSGRVVCEPEMQRSLSGPLACHGLGHVTNAQTARRYC